MRLLLFTCRRDWGKAALAVRTVPPGWSVAYVVEPKDAGLPPPPGVELIVRDFPRGASLCGAEAVLPIADILASEAARFGRVGKIDSDCLLVETDWLTEGEVAGAASKAWPLATWGLAYSLSSKAAQRAARGVRRAVSQGCRVVGEATWITSCGNGWEDTRLGPGSFWETPYRGTLPTPGTVAIHCGAVRYVQRASPAVEAEMKRLGDALGLWRRTP